MKRIVTAPYRILDCGGWTDTSFMPGGKGACTNVAINLSVHITFEPKNSHKLIIRHRASESEEVIDLPFKTEGNKIKTLAEAAVAALQLSVGDGGIVTVESDVLPGSGLGGSATYAVALLGALNPKLISDQLRISSLAQELETKWLGHSCGTQDQMAAAYGGVSFSEIKYPSFTHESIQLSPEFLSLLEDNLLVVYTGESHFSSAMHHTVIEELERGVESVVAAFHTLHECGRKAAEALRDNNMEAYKEILNQNWTAQKQLHKGITTENIESLHALARSVDSSLAFKGSGAGGGGSVALIVDSEKRSTIASIIREKYPNMMVWDNLRVAQGVAIKSLEAGE
jgi:D-glycero-alpha-D-manno-heptose-7-phosphate kinase